MSFTFQNNISPFSNSPSPRRPSPYSGTRPSTSRDHSLNNVSGSINKNSSNFYFSPNTSNVSRGSFYHNSGSPCSFSASSGGSNPRTRPYTPSRSHTPNSYGYRSASPFNSRGTNSFKRPFNKMSTPLVPTQFRNKIRHPSPKSFPDSNSSGSSNITDYYSPQMVIDPWKEIAPVPVTKANLTTT